MTLPVQLSARLAALREKTQATRGRLLFAIDATASRGDTWDTATSMTAPMLTEGAKLGGLDMQIVSYGGYGEFQKSAWTSDVTGLIDWMTAVRCKAGATQIARVLRHIGTENEREKVTAAVFVGDACEEEPSVLYDAAAGLNVPLFIFQEGDGEVAYLDQRGEPTGAYPPLKVEQVFREIARLTGGAYGKFDAGAAKQLGELLRAVAAFATGGLKALASQQTDSARKLLTQMKNGD